MDDRASPTPDHAQPRAHVWADYVPHSEPRRPGAGVQCSLCGVRAASAEHGNTETCPPARPRRLPMFMRGPEDEAMSEREETRPGAHPMILALELVRAERERQVLGEGFDAAHDDSLIQGDLARAAACYALPERSRPGHKDRLWPWLASWWKPTPKDRVRELVKAGALIVAEIERLQRAKDMGGGR